MTTRPRSRVLSLSIPADFSGGAGAQRYRPGFYQIGVNWDGRYNCPGPREVADMTGIAAGYRVYQALKHADTNVLITSNGTDTKVYREESSAWAEKATISNRVPTGPQCAVSFSDVLAIAFGNGNPYQFTTNTGSGAWTFTASTKTAGNADEATCFLVQSSGLLTPRVVYGRSPNEVYYTEDLTNGDATGVTPTLIGDDSTNQQKITSIAQDRVGRLLVGTRHALYSVHLEDGIVEALVEGFADPPTDAGGQSDRDNFEGPVHLAGRIYYPVEGYDLGEWDPMAARFNRYMAPRHTNRNLPRLDLPINTICAAGGWLLLFLGSKNTGTLKSVTYAPGGNSHLAHQFTTASELWVGAYVGDTWVWHGVLLECTAPLRYCWWDEDDAYLYLASGDSESADAQQRRCLFVTENPLHRLSSSNVVLQNGAAKWELGAIDFGDEWAWKRATRLTVEALGLSGTVGTDPSLKVEYKVTPDYDTTAFTEQATYYVNSRAAQGDDFRSMQAFRKMHLRFTATGTGNTYAIFRGAELQAALEDEAYDRTVVRR